MTSSIANSRLPYLKSENLKGIAFVLPGIVWIFVFFLLPLIRMLQISFYHHEAGGGLTPGFTIENYIRFISDSFYLNVLFDTLMMGIQVTLICLVLGYPVAYTLAKLRGRIKSLLYVLVILPLVTGLVVRTIGWLILLGRNGIINRILVESGIIADPLRILFTPYATIIGLAEVLLPFMILSINSVLENIDPHIEEAAQSLGANYLNVFSHIVLPLSIPGIATGSVLVFVLTVSSYVTPAILGGESHLVIPILVYRQANALLNWPFAAAISFTLLALLAFVTYFYFKLIGKKGLNG